MHINKPQHALRQLVIQHSESHMLGRSVNGLSTYIHRVTEEGTLAEASRALIDEEIEVSVEEEVSVFEELVKK